MFCYQFKKRPLFWSSLFFCCGIITGFYGNLIFFLLNLIAGLLVLQIFSNCQKTMLLFIILFLAGIFIVLKQENNYYHEYSVINWNEKGVVNLIAKIQKPLDSVEGNFIYLKPISINGIPVKFGLIQLRRTNIINKELFKESFLIKTKIELSFPDRANDLDGFCYYSFLKQNKIFSQGNIAGKTVILEKNNNIRKKIIDSKNKLLFFLDENLNKPYNQVMKALLLGERDNLPDNWQDKFSKAGANHLLAISGLHVGFVVMLFYFLLTAFKFPLLLRNILITVFLLNYITVTGAGASVVRAGLMAVLFLWAPVFKRKGDIFNILGFTVFVNLLINPYALFMVSFQLTYLVLLMIVFWAPILQKMMKIEVFKNSLMQKIMNFLTGSFALSMSAQLGSIPLTAYYFNQITPGGLLTNLWAVPLAAVIVCSGFILFFLVALSPVISILPAQILSFLLEHILDFFKYGMRFISLLPGSYWQVNSPSVFTLSFSYLLLFFLSFFLQERVVPLMRKNLSK